MKKEDLKQKIGFVVDDSIEKTILVYVTTDTTGLQLFNIVEKDLKDLKKMFVGSVKSQILDLEYELENYSKSIKRVDVLYVYDLSDKHTVEMKRMGEVTNIVVPEYFDKSTTKIERINGIYIVIKDNDNKNVITLFKNITNVDKAYAAASFMIFGKEDKKFERQKENMLRITPTFHMLLVDDEVILIDLEKIEKPLHLDAILQKETERDVAAISKDLIINNSNLMKVCQKPSICKKLRHALNKSKVVSLLKDGKLTGAKVIEFVENKTSLKFHFNKSKTKFEIKSDSEAIRFVKLMDDDYLLSELTGEKNDSSAKDPQPIENKSKVATKPRKVS